MVWVQAYADGLQVNFSTPPAFLYRVKEVFKKAGWSTDGGKKGLYELGHTSPPVIQSWFSLLAKKSLPAAKMELNLLQIKCS